MPLPDAYASCLVRINLKKSPAADGAHTGGCCCFVLKGVITTDYSTNTSISAKTAVLKCLIMTDYPTNTSISAKTAVLKCLIMTDYPTNTSTSAKTPVLKCLITTDYPTNTSISAKIAAVTSTVEALCVREGKVMSAYKGTASELTLLSKLIQTQRAHTYDSINKLIQHQTAKHL